VFSSPNTSPGTSDSISASSPTALTSEKTEALLTLAGSADWLDAKRACKTLLGTEPLPALSRDGDSELVVNDTYGVTAWKCQYGVAYQFIINDYKIASDSYIDMNGNTGTYGEMPVGECDEAFSDSFWSLTCMSRSVGIVKFIHYRVGSHASEPATNEELAAKDIIEPMLSV